MKIPITTFCFIGAVCALISGVFVFFTKDDPKVTATSKGLYSSNIAGLFMIIFLLLGVYHLALVANMKGYIDQETTLNVYPIQSVANHTINIENATLDTRIDVHYFEPNNEEYQNTVRDVAIHSEKKIKYFGFIDAIITQDTEAKIANVTKEDYETIKKVEMAPEYKEMLEEIRAKREQKEKSS